MKKRRKRRGNRGPMAMEWLEEAVGGIPRVWMVGGRRAMVEDHRGVLAFCDAEVRVLVKGGEMKISGANLLLGELGAQSLMIRGEIRSIELIR